jgi:hypothetical protein
MRALFCVLASLIALPALAANPNPPAPSNLYGLGHFAGEAQLGLGTPVGAAGVMFDADIHPDVSLTAGIGYGFGWQTGALIRYRRGRVPMRWGFGLGASRGPAGDRVTDFLAGNVTYGPHWQQAWWVNIEMFIESRYESGLRWRCSLGGTAVVNISDCVWSSQDRTNGEHCSKSLPLPYLGCAIGIGR